MIKSLKAIVKAFFIYLYDFNQDLRYTTLVHGLDTKEKLLSSLVISAHTIEKGLTMPNRHIPFGESKVEAIASGCMKYINKGYDKKDLRFVDVVGILQEYINTVQTVEVSGVLKEKVNSVVNSIQPGNVLLQHYSVKHMDYFFDSDSSFKDFSFSRHSCRYLMGHVDDNTLMNALRMSMNAPSTCNRQSHRIHLIKTAEAKELILSIQNGSRNFGDMVDQFILVTSDLSCWKSGSQRNGPYIDGGIYLMNLLYCLHFCKIAACTLNLYLDKANTLKLHRSLSIPDNEVPVALIAIGIPPGEFSLTRSYRRKADEVIVFH